MTTDPNKKTIKLRTSDDKLVTADLALVSYSSLIRNILGDCSDIPDELPVANVTASVLEKVLEYLEHHHKLGDLPTPEQEEAVLREEELDDGAQYARIERLRQSVLSDWDCSFLLNGMPSDQGIDQHHTVDLMLAANFLDIRPLLALGTKAMAAEMDKCKTAAEVRSKFGLKKDLTDEQEAEIMKEFAWADYRP
ncbi:Skp1 family, dimerization domain-containing protein [Blastocladiella britannica]|nr:Skp1 family, dimerization domain-containing protein [Blastocladiella britannica]